MVKFACLIELVVSQLFQAISDDSMLACIHDSARPLVLGHDNQRVDAWVHGAAVLGVRVKATIKEAGSDHFVKKTLVAFARERLGTTPRAGRALCVLVLANTPFPICIAKWVFTFKTIKMTCLFIVLNCRKENSSWSGNPTIYIYNRRFTVSLQLYLTVARPLTRSLAAVGSPVKAVPWARARSFPPERARPP
ncbi:uncharacterized protein LOC112351083 [Selaginella moellendorffii]|uniref:uncharacterized protein LOC112351083 n=1 Tax=Selaginella moellendorffii TaxID=88036 RepID=UPI000D1CD3A9|nr:uncharacterized protein LOC112351083 [Selaginella moellendorffii]|eukprot:XP_024544030.1 uncharacterized protein LOC112351083 [Selaginella moellendorffii]